MAALSSPHQTKKVIPPTVATANPPSNVIHLAAAQNFFQGYFLLKAVGTAYERDVSRTFFSMRVTEESRSLLAFDVPFSLEGRKLSPDQAEKLGRKLFRAIQSDARLSGHSVIRHEICVGPPMACREHDKMRDAVIAFSTGKLHRDLEAARHRGIKQVTQGITDKMMSVELHINACFDCRLIKTFGSTRILEPKTPLSRLLSSKEIAEIHEILRTAAVVGTA